MLKSLTGDAHGGFSKEGLDTLRLEWARLLLVYNGRQARQP